MSARKWLFFVLVIAILAGWFIPRRTVVAPEWKLTLTNESGRPMAGIIVGESWQHYSLENAGHHDEASSDANGVVLFPSRVVRSSPAQRFVGCLRQFSRYAVHASCGPASSLNIVYPSGFGQNDVPEFAQAELMWSGGSSRRSDVVVVHKCRNGGTGLTCFL